MQLSHGRESLTVDDMPTESTTPEKGWLSRIRREWDARARENARAYINWPDIANEEGAFFTSGRRDYECYVTPFLKKMQVDPKGKVALEIGCGIGRIARWMAADFGHYIGVDVSNSACGARRSPRWKVLPMPRLWSTSQQNNKICS